MATRATGGEMPAGDMECGMTPVAAKAGIAKGADSPAVFLTDRLQSSLTILSRSRLYLESPGRLFSMLFLPFSSCCSPTFFTFLS